MSKRKASNTINTQQPPNKKPRLEKNSFLSLWPLIRIFQHLRLSNLVQLQLVCKKFQNVLFSSHEAWEKVCFSKRYIPERYHPVMCKLMQFCGLYKMSITNARNLREAKVDELSIVIKSCNTLIELDVTVHAIPVELRFPNLRKLLLQKCCSYDSSSFPMLQELELHECMVNSAECFSNCNIEKLSLYSCQISGSVTHDMLLQLNYLKIEGCSYPNLFVEPRMRLQEVHLYLQQDIAPVYMPNVRTLTLQHSVDLDILKKCTNLSNLILKNTSTLTGSTPFRKGLCVTFTSSSLAPPVSSITFLSEMTIVEGYITWKRYNDWMKVVGNMPFLKKASMHISSMLEDLPESNCFPLPICPVTVVCACGTFMEDCAAFLICTGSTLEIGYQSKCVLPRVAFTILKKRFTNVPWSVLQHWEAQSKLPVQIDIDILKNLVAIESEDEEEEED